MAKHTRLTQINAPGFSIGRLNSMACACASLIHPDFSAALTSPTAAHRYSFFSENAITSQ
jgi:hypothetical protein